ncbi:MAG: winged helix-turn-helix transcriptional regulator [Nitrospiraceae bacterium]|nr:winged helix-turn-helix transcriptional regulator [Nitrospiraceae bacterium]
MTHCGRPTLSRDRERREVRVRLGKTGRQVREHTLKSSLKHHPPAGTCLTVGPLILVREQRAVTLRRRLIRLTRREFDLLWALAEQPGKVFRREELLGLVWGKNLFVTARTIDVHMAKLRHKLREAEENEIAETIWGVGYRLALTFRSKR